jgi:hypothetical protein
MVDGARSLGLDPNYGRIDNVLGLYTKYDSTTPEGQAAIMAACMEMMAGDMEVNFG